MLVHEGIATFLPLRRELAARRVHELNIAADGQFEPGQVGAEREVDVVKMPIAKILLVEADPFRDVLDERFREALTEAISGLPDRERTVMSLYYDDELNLKEIGAVLKVSESRICQIHGQALTRLQARLSGWRDRLA